MFQHQVHHWKSHLTMGADSPGLSPWSSLPNLHSASLEKSSLKTVHAFVAQCMLLLSSPSEFGENSDTNKSRLRHSVCCLLNQLWAQIFPTTLKIGHNISFICYHSNTSLNIMFFCGLVGLQMIEMMLWLHKWLYHHTW